VFGQRAGINPASVQLATASALNWGQKRRLPTKQRLVRRCIADNRDCIFYKDHDGQDLFKGDRDPFFDELRLCFVQSVTNEFVVPLHDPCLLMGSLEIELDVMYIGPISCRPGPHGRFPVQG